MARRFIWYLLLYFVSKFHLFFALFCCRMSEEEYVKAIKEEINKVVKLQEELDIDVLVHGEPEVCIFACTT